MMQPIATRLSVPMPNSSAPRIAAITMSRPVFSPPSARSRMRPRRPLRVNVWLTSDSPISHGVPAYLMLVWGDAPVPPTWPETRMTSACALATPAATVPMPADETSFTHTRARGLICLQS